MRKVGKIIIILLISWLLPLAFVSALEPSFPCPEGLACSLPGGTGTATGGISSINSLIATIVNWLLGIAFAVTVLFLVIGGFRYIISGGNEESADAAKSTIINALIGLVIIILSYTIVNVVSNFFSRPSVSP